MVDISKMEDDEILETLQEAFEDDGRLEMDYIDFEVVNASITISGRVSSEDELQIIDDIMKEIKITDYTNNAWVDDTLIFGERDDDESAFAGTGITTFDDDDDIDDDYKEDDDEDYDI